MSLMDNESLVREEREPNNDENSSTWSIQLVGAFTFEPLSRVSEFGILHFKTMQISCCFINLDTVLHFWFSSTQDSMCFNVLRTAFQVTLSTMWTVSPRLSLADWKFQ